jgi:hypothetical protein
LKKLSTVLLLAMLLIFANAPQADAAFEWPMSEWNIPFIGTMKTPDGFSVVEVKDFRSFIDQERKKSDDPKKMGPDKSKQGNVIKPMPEVPAGTPSILTEALPKDTDAATKRFLKSDFAMYHLSVDDGETIHTAWFLAARDGDKMPANMDVFIAEPTMEQTQKLDELNKWVDENIHKAQYTDEKTKVSMKMIQMLPVQALLRENGTLWTTAGRAVITVEEMPFAIFARVYAMSIDNKLTVGILAGFDGERLFWDPVIRDMLLGLRENSVTQ